MSDIEARKVLEIINKNISLSQGNIFQFRKDIENLHLKFSSNQDLTVRKQEIKGIDTYKIHTEGVDEDNTILFFHGGAFTIGSTKDHLDLCGKLSSSSNLPVLSVDYRLAPEHKFPAALEDCIIVYLSLLKNGIKPSNIILGGISAGGTLTLALLLYLKEKNIELPLGAVCMSPVVDMLFQGHSVFTNDGKDWITRKRLSNLRKIYLKDRNPKNPLVSPLYGDLHELPPILLQVGSNELLLDGIIMFHQKAKKADVEISFELWKDMFHCFQIFSSRIEEGQNAINNAGKYIKTLLK